MPTNVVPPLTPDMDVNADGYGADDNPLDEDAFDKVQNVDLSTAPPVGMDVLEDADKANDEFGAKHNRIMREMKRMCDHPLCLSVEDAGGGF